MVELAWWTLLVWDSTMCARVRRRLTRRCRWNGKLAYSSVLLRSTCGVMWTCWLPSAVLEFPDVVKTLLWTGLQIMLIMGLLCLARVTDM